MYKSLHNFSCDDGKYFKGEVYDNLPSEKKYHNRFEKVEKKSKGKSKKG